MKRVVLLVALAITRLVQGQIFSDQAANLDPEMREYTSTSYLYSRVVRYGDGNSLHCSQRTMPDGTHQWECTRLENGVILPAEVVFRDYTPFRDTGDVLAQVSVTPNGDAVAIAPRADRQGVRLAFQRRTVNGSYEPWVESRTVVNTGRLHGAWVSVQDSLERLQILTLSLAREQNPSDPFTPSIRFAEIVFTPSTPIVTIQALRNLGDLGLSVPQGTQPEVVLVNDAVRRKIIHVLPTFGFTAFVVGTYEHECAWESTIDYGTPGVGDTLQAGEIAHDFDRVSGRLYFLVTKGWNRIGGNSTSFTTLFPSPVPGRRQFFDYGVATRRVAGPGEAFIVAVKALGEDRVAIAWADMESLHWQIYFPALGWSPVMGGIPFSALFPDPDSSTRTVFRDLVDIAVAPHTGEIVLAAWGFAPDRFGRALYAQAYDPKTRRHGDAQLVTRLSSGYNALFAIIGSRGLNSSYSWRVNPLMGEPISSKNQQITLGRDWLRAGNLPGGNHGLAWNAERRLVWTVPNAIVEEAPDLAGPWTPRADWASPQKVPVGSGSQFFRLKVSSP